MNLVGWVSIDWRHTFECRTEESDKRALQGFKLPTKFGLRTRTSHKCASSSGPSVFAEQHHNETNWTNFVRAVFVIFRFIESTDDLWCCMVMQNKCEPHYYYFSDKTRARHVQALQMLLSLVGTNMLWFTFSIQTGPAQNDTLHNHDFVNWKNWERPIGDGDSFPWSSLTLDDGTILIHQTQFKRIRFKATIKLQHSEV